MATKKTQKLFGDFASKVGGIPGMVTPSITSDITQKSEEDDPSTLAGYKKRLELQRGEQENASRSHAEWGRQMQLQWEQEDMKRAAEQMRMLDKQRKEAYDVYYRPQVESQMRMGQENTRTMAGIANQQVMNANMNRPGDMPGPVPGSIIRGGVMIGPPLGGVNPGQVQQVLNRQYAQTATAMQGANTNPYYHNPYAYSGGGGGGPIGIRDPVTGIYG